MFSKTEKRFPRKDTCLAIYSHRVNTQGTLEATLRDAFPVVRGMGRGTEAPVRAYVERKLDNQALDYDDLLLYWHAMMADAALAREIGGRWDHVLVDEYQDTNVLQAEILRRLRPTGEGLTVVGDDAQAIYSFRAATVENILEFREAVRARQVVTLEENYRSTQPVLDAANALMRESVAAISEGTARGERGEGAEAALRDGGGRRGAGAVRGDAGAGGAGAGRGPQAPGGAVPRARTTRTCWSWSSCAGTSPT